MCFFDKQWLCWNQNYSFECAGLEEHVAERPKSWNWVNIGSSDDNITEATFLPFINTDKKTAICHWKPKSRKRVLVLGQWWRIWETAQLHGKLRAAAKCVKVFPSCERGHCVGGGVGEWEISKGSVPGQPFPCYWLLNPCPAGSARDGQGGRSCSSQNPSHNTTGPVRKMCFSKAGKCPWRLNLKLCLPMA